MTTAYITHSDCLRHEMGAGHPENPERLSAVNLHMRDAGLLEQLRCLEAPLAEPEDIKRVHRPAYVDLIFDNAPTEGLRAARSRHGHESLQPCCRAPRCRARASSRWTRSWPDAPPNAFCAVRPCGHHATQARPMGFCIFNNIASRRRLCARDQGSRARGHHRFRRASRQRHRGHVQRAGMAKSRDHGELLSASRSIPAPAPIIPRPTCSTCRSPPAATVPRRGDAFEDHWLPALDAFNRR